MVQCVTAFLDVAFNEMCNRTKGKLSIICNQVCTTYLGGEMPIRATSWQLKRLTNITNLHTSSVYIEPKDQNQIRGDNVLHKLPTVHRGLLNSLGYET
jgi:hypothetical protein